MPNVIKKKTGLNGEILVIDEPVTYGNYAVIERKHDVEINRAETLEYDEALMIYNDKN